ncbi:hypothetical protein AB0C27_20475 [Nonomuraea sp. NPDC048882]|uniref:Uncharacterized protein n=1 Tax=Nonomuraea fuscirosea TaxID=1291556 RepID=A0A2T0MP81_9ACTN|nr:hypothetical protein [Nonomuraea fuscirosea]PRX59865.1 hypothetical protein B0I32_1184 [Nonomuraea fuscirosea]
MFSVRWPHYFDEQAPLIEAKGWFSDVLVEREGQYYRPVFYDPVRLGQEIAEEMSNGAGFFREPNLVVVDRVTRDHIEAAISALVDNGFNLLPE